MDIKPRPNQKQYIEALRRMTPEQRLMKSFELTETARALFRHGLRRLHPDLSEEELHKLYLEKCHNRNW